MNDNELSKESYWPASKSLNLLYFFEMAGQYKLSFGAKRLNSGAHLMMKEKVKGTY
jgi:hypothetical protein